MLSVKILYLFKTWVIIITTIQVEIPMSDYHLRRKFGSKLIINYSLQKVYLSVVTKLILNNYFHVPWYSA